MRKWIRNNRGLIAFLLTFGLFRTAVADWNPVPSGSMRPTIQEGDVVLVDRLAYNLKVPLTNIVLAHTGEPARGDIVTFHSPIDGVRLLKRLVAVPGDRVEMRDKVLLINDRPATYALLGTAVEHAPDGSAVDARLLAETADGRTHVVQWLRPAGSSAWDSFGPLVIPAGHYLMLGDNRDNSADSRAFGLVPRELLIGSTHRILVSADIKGNWAPRAERFGKKLDAP
ncbi:MAG: signal peptidase I [Arenimonas sp.]